MITLPIIVLGALTGVSEGQTIRHERKLASALKDTWQKGQCYMQFSTRKRNVAVKEDCVQECSSFLGINYNEKEKSCYCIEVFTQGKEDGQIWTGSPDMECFLYGSCSRLEEGWCGSAENCSWDKTKGNCSADTSVPEYDSEMLEPQFKNELKNTVAKLQLPRCSVIFDGGRELAENAECRDDNLDKCRKKDVDANNECPGDVWEKDPCEAKKVDTFDNVASQNDCKNKCSDEQKYIAINFWSNKSKCECIVQGELYSYTPDNGDNSVTCFIYPGAEEDNASTTEICSGINLLSDCESSGDMKELCAEECADIRKNFADGNLEDEKDNHICDEVMECNERLWGVCAHRCAVLYLHKKNGTLPSKGTSNHHENLKNEEVRQQKILKQLEENEGSEEKMNEIIEGEKQRFRAMISEKGDGDEITPKAEFARELSNLPMEKANRALARENSEPNNGNADDNPIFDNPFTRSLMSGNVESVRKVTQAYLETSDRPRNRRALQVLHQNTQDDIATVISRAKNGVALSSAAGSNVFGNLGATLSLVVPFMGVINADNTAEGKFRSLVEFKLNIAAQVTKKMGPIGTLFKVATGIVHGVNTNASCKSDKGSRVNCTEELTQELPGIVLTSVLGAIGNGHLSDLYNIFKMGERIVAKKSLKALQVKDIMTLGAAAMRGGCAIATFAFPLVSTPCNFAVKLIEILNDTGIFSNPRNEKILDDILGAIENNPVVKHVLPVIGEIVKIGSKVANFTVRAAAKCFNVLGAIAGGVFDFIGIGPTKAAIVSPYSRRPHHRRGRRGIQRVINTVAGAADKVLGFIGGLR